MTVTTEYGKQNIFAKETPPRIMTHNHDNDQWHIAEELNGRFAMFGLIVAIGTYITTGQIIPGIF